MSKNTLTPIAALAALLLAVPGCTDITTMPKSSVSSGNIFNDAGSYRAFLAKLYAGLAVTGQQGPAGAPDIEGIDEGFSQYIRGFWQLQTLPTDEAVIGWGDDTLPEMNTHLWGPGNRFITAFYYRIFFQVALVNEFLRETTDAKLADRGASQELRAEVQRYRAEARFLRALSYWHGIDMFGDIPLVRETDQLGARPPEQSTRAEIYDFIIAELNDIRSTLPAQGQAQYGRADQGAVNMLLAKLYLNSQAYGLAARWNEALSATQAVIAGPYQLAPTYIRNFLADNHTSPEMVFPVPFDGMNTRTWGGMTFLVHAAVGGNMNGADYGIGGGWWGLRTTQQFVALFPGGPASDDQRAMFFTNGQQVDVTELGNFFTGYALPKYRNLRSNGAQGSNSQFPDTDFPMFRLADAYLMYAEAHLRGGGGTRTQALQYVNALRQRAYGNTSGNITDAQLNLDLVLDERARELYWEGHRRTDLIRFGRFTGGTYLWAWKGNIAAGRATDAFRSLYPIPGAELLANPNLKQNTGYGN
jgi:starch-binding outer membrane protein, SusD/RagB family